MLHAISPQIFLISDVRATFLGVDVRHSEMDLQISLIGFELPFSKLIRLLLMVILQRDPVFVGPRIRWLVQGVAGPGFGTWFGAHCADQLGGYRKRHLALWSTCRLSSYSLEFLSHVLYFFASSASCSSRIQHEIIIYGGSAWPWLAARSWPRRSFSSHKASHCYGGAL